MQRCRHLPIGIADILEIQPSDVKVHFGNASILQDVEIGD